MELHRHLGMRLWLWLAILIGANGATSPLLTTWQTFAVNGSIRLPIAMPVPFPLEVNWGDNQNETVNTSTLSPITHSYSTPGLHNVSILGDIYGFSFGALPAEAAKIVDIASWGDGLFVNSTSSSMFKDCINLRVSAPRQTHPVFLPNATLESMFDGCSSFNSGLDWNLTNVRSLAYMFFNATQMNQAVTFTNTDEVTDVGYMFCQATNFNQPVNFDTKNVKSMQAMFSEAASFNQTLNFNTSSVNDMNFVFLYASSFNRPVTFDTRQVVQMQGMFAFAVSFNQPLNFDTRQVTDMGLMFQGARAFNQPVNFDTSRVTNMQLMFQNATSFNQPIAFNTTKVSAVWGMFSGATSFNQPVSISGSNLTSTESMFEGATSFNHSVVLSNTNRMTTAARMFANANKCFNNTVSFSYTMGLTDISEMFLNVGGFQQNLGTWQLQAGVNCSRVCPQCGLPSSCTDPCGGPPSIVTTENVSVCNIPNRAICGALCDLATVSANLQAECIHSKGNSTTTGGGIVISPLFEITHTNTTNPNSTSDFVFTLPIDPRFYDAIGTLSCSGAELSCEWQDPQSLEFQRSGCAVSRERVDMGSGIVGTQCTCTHLTVFAIAMRSEMRLTPLCHAQEIDYALLALYAVLACALMLQTIKVVLYHRLHESFLVLITQHSVLLLTCALRVAYLVLKPMIQPLWGLVLLGLLPTALALILFIHVLLVWASLQLSSLQLDPFARFRTLFVVVIVLVLLLVAVVVALVAIIPEVVIVRGGSYAFAALTAVVCVLVLWSGLGLSRSLGKLMDVFPASSSPSSLSSSSSPSSPSSQPRPTWRELVRHRVLVATAVLSVCLLLVTCLWAAAVQTDIIVSSAATLATSASFYVFDWLSLCAMTWLFSVAVKKPAEHSHSSRAHN